MNTNQLVDGNLGEAARTGMHAAFLIKHGTLTQTLAQKASKP
jgi:hypothetical protein